MTATAPSSDTAAPLVPLARNRAFQLLWAGSASAFLGLFEIEVAVPLVLLALTRSAGQATLFALVQAVATVVLGVPAGHLLDCFDRRKILVCAEAGRALALGTVVLAQWADDLTVAHLLGVAALLGGTQAFGTARVLLVRAVVAPEQFTGAVTAEEARTNAAELGGPPLGGLLFGLGHALPFVFGTLAFAFSTVMAFLVKVPARPRDEPEGRNGVFSGLDVVLQEPTMRAVTFVIMLVNGIVWPARLATIVLLQHDGTRPWEIGAALSGLAVGGLVGTIAVTALHRRLEPGSLLLGVGASQVLALLALAVPLGPWWAGGAFVGYGLGIPAVRVLIDVLIVRRIPDAERGRALSGIFTLFGLVLPSVSSAPACSSSTSARRARCPPSPPYWPPASDWPPPGAASARPAGLTRRAPESPDGRPIPGSRARSGHTTRSSRPVRGATCTHGSRDLARPLAGVRRDPPRRHAPGPRAHDRRRGEDPRGPVALR